MLIGSEEILKENNRICDDNDHIDFFLGLCHYTSDQFAPQGQNTKLQRKFSLNYGFKSVTTDQPNVIKAYNCYYTDCIAVLAITVYPPKLCRLI